MSSVTASLTKFGPDDMEQPLLSVLMISYNHAPFIRQALDSIQDQRTSFPIEIVIGEDCSTDETRQIAREFAAGSRVPVALIERTQNVGMVRNFEQTLAACRGKYIAMLEGDDWWTEPEKLEQQVCALEANPSLAFSFHQVRWIKEVDGAARWDSGHDWPTEVPNPVTFDAVADQIFIQTGSVVFRRSMLPELPAWARQLPSLDWLLFLLLAANGGAHWIRKVMSAYRQHPLGATARMRTISGHRSSAQMFELLPAVLPARLNGTCLRMRLKHLCMLATEQEAAGQANEACRTMMRLLFLELKNFSIQRRTLVWALRLSFPRLHRISLRLRGSA